MPERPGGRRHQAARGRRTLVLGHSEDDRLTARSGRRGRRRCSEAMQRIVERKRRRDRRSGPASTSQNHCGRVLDHLGQPRPGVHHRAAQRGHSGGHGLLGYRRPGPHGHGQRHTLETENGLSSGRGGAVGAAAKKTASCSSWAGPKTRSPAMTSPPNILPGPDLDNWNALGDGTLQTRRVYPALAQESTFFFVAGGATPSNALDWSADGRLRREGLACSTPWSPRATGGGHAQVNLREDDGIDDLLYKRLALAAVLTLVQPPLSPNGGHARRAAPAPATAQAATPPGHRSSATASTEMEVGTTTSSSIRRAACRASAWSSAPRSAGASTDLQRLRHHLATGLELGYTLPVLDRSIEIFLDRQYTAADFQPEPTSAPTAGCPATAPGTTT